MRVFSRLRNGAWPIWDIFEKPMADDPLKPRHDLSKPRPLRVYLPVLLAGDLVQSPEHLGPAYLAAVLRRAGAEVRIRSVSSDAESVAATVSEIAAFRPDILGLSLTTVAIGDSKNFGIQAREALGNDTFIVAGGPLATHLGAELASLPGWEFLDALIRGEGEISMLRLAEAVHGNTELGAVPSLCYREGEAVRSTPIAAGPRRLNDLPFPDRDQLLEYGGKLPYLRISTSRGCTAHCTFCNAPHTRNRVGPPIKAWRGRSPKSVVDEMEQLVERYGLNTFDFVDSTFEDPGGGAIGKARVEAIADEILDRDLTVYFNVCMQAHNWREADWPLLKKLWDAGLEKVLVGIEAGSDIGLHRWEKQSTVADNVRILALLKRLGVFTAFGFIAFHPWTRFDEYRENVAFLRDHAGHNLRRFTTRLELYPGAEVIDHLDKDGLLDPSYRETLNIYAYRFRDPRIERLAACLNSIYGAEYQGSGTLTREPAVFAFETFDIVVNNFSTRLRRALQDDAVGLEILGAFDSKVDVVRDRLAAFNADFVGEMTDRAERDILNPADAAARAGPIETLFSAAMREIEDEKLLAGLHLRRHGVDVGAISRGRALAEAV